MNQYTNHMEESTMFSKLQSEAYAVMHEVIELIKGQTADNPLILYNKDELDGTDDKFYELPYAYYVDKHNSYCEGRIVQIEGDNVLMLFTGEEFGEEHHLELNQCPFESLVDVLSYLEKRQA